MFKYLKKLFHDVMIQSQKFMGITDNPEVEIDRPEEEGIERERMENESNSRIINSSMFDTTLYGSSRINRVGCIDPRDRSRHLEVKKSGLENSISEKSLRAEETNKRNSDNTYNRMHESSNEEILMRDTTENEEKFCRKDDICNCENCSTVSVMNECGVCLEPLQTRGVRSCPLCANIVCSVCASRLNKCAFCRICLPMQKNRAIERLLDKLSLPCRNARNGCEKLLKSETRLRHEVNCDYATITCPVLRAPCNWQGSQSEILNHLKEAHNLKPLAYHGIAIQVLNFRDKSVDKQRQCTIYLSCYSQLFAVKVTPYRKKLILTFCKLGYVGPVTDKIANTKYGLWMRVKGGSGKTVRGILPFGTLDREIRQIEIDSDKLFSKRSSSSQVADTVNIEISIKEISNATKV